MYAYDTETCGFHGPTVLIQYQGIDTEGVDRDRNKIKLHDVWLTPIDDTLSLIEDLMDKGVIGFNLTFDHFHLCQTYTTLLLLRDAVGGDRLPIDHIELYASLESEARDGPCLKPRHALDLMLYARKGPYQSTMERKNIIVKRVPLVLARDLQSKLDEVVELEDIYFARRKEYKEYNWDISTCKDDPNFADLTLRFKPSAALKVLAMDALGIDDPLLMKDVHAEPAPMERGFAPFATAISSAEKHWRCRWWQGQVLVKGSAWPGVIKEHISHWGHNELARRYATDDVQYTRDLYYHFRDTDDSELVIDDNDSVLACQVAASRWRGYAIDVDGIKELRDKAAVLANKAPKSPSGVYEWIEPHLSGEEKAIIGESTNKAILEALARMKEPCETCAGTGDSDGLLGILRGDTGQKQRVKECPVCTGYVGEDTCEECDGRGVVIVPTAEINNPCPDCEGTGDTTTEHPAARYAKECLDARKAQKEIENWDKLLTAGRFHASNKIIGTLSGRMAGADGLNAQGIKHDKYVREKFPLAFGGLELAGGDFMSFEVSIIEALCDDPKLREELSRCAKCKKVWPLELYASQIECPFCGEKDGNEPCRQKFHGLFAMGLKPGITYDEVVASKGTVNDYYDKGKRGGFAKFYGGNANTLVTRGLCETEEEGQAVIDWFDDTFTGSRRFSEEIHDDFCSMRQPDGIGSNVEWNDPKDYVESMVGFRRYFTVENRICKKLYDLSTNLPKNWKELKGTCVRRDREQKISGAVMSALFAAAFSIQAKNVRAAGNHRIQSTGATITKELQKRLWDMQPVGVNRWHVQPLNVHDELMTPMLPELKPKAREIVNGLLDDYKELIPLIAIGWADSLTSWADK